MFFDDLAKDLKQNLHQTCAWNINPHAKPTSSDLKSELIHQRLCDLHSLKKNARDL